MINSAIRLTITNVKTGAEYQVLPIVDVFYIDDVLLHDDTPIANQLVSFANFPAGKQWISARKNECTLYQASVWLRLKHMGHTFSGTSYYFIMMHEEICGIIGVYTCEHEVFEFSYILNPKHSGVMFLAIRELIKSLRQQEPNCMFQVAICPFNVKSQSVAKRCGFTRTMFSELRGSGPHFIWQNNP